MIDLLKGCISEQGLSFQPDKINLDFEIAAHFAFRASFPNATLLTCFASFTSIRVLAINEL
jgi:hypothetical protein